MIWEAIALVASLALAARTSRAAESDSPDAGARPPVARPAETGVSTDELRQVPGALGDVGKGLESLPGVARPAFDHDGLMVWGADTGDTRVLGDGMEIPGLYHLTSVRSVVGGAMIDSMVLSPGGYGANLGRALGGVVNLETRSPPLRGYFGELDANLLDASFAAGAGFCSGGLAVGGQTSHIGGLMYGLLPDAPGPNSFESYRDLQAKALFALRQGERIELVGLYSSDSRDASFGMPFTAYPRREQSFFRVGAKYTRTLADGGSLFVLPFAGSERSQTTWMDRFDVGYTPSTTDSLSGKDVGLRASYRKPLTRLLTTELGFDGLLGWSDLRRMGDPNMPAREGDIVVWGKPFGTAIAGDSWSATMGNLAPSVSLDLAAGKWRLIPSFRADIEVISRSQEFPTSVLQERMNSSRLSWAPTPRLLVAHQTTSRVRNHIAVGLYHQPPSPADMSIVFGSPSLGLSHAMHAVAGTEVALLPGLAVEGTAFYRQLWNLVTRNPNLSPALGQTLVQDGQGRAYGAELLVHLKSSIVSGWLSYTYSRSERRQSANATYRLFDFDQTHVASAVAAATYAGFLLGARLRVGSGMPRTPILGAYYNAMDENYEPVFGPQTASDFPASVRSTFASRRPSRTRGSLSRPTSKPST